jgi:hypothetical protein
MARVWDLSKHKGSDLLMMLAIADFSDDDGRAYPSVQTLATKCRISSTRHVNRILVVLRDSGELHVGISQGPRGTNLYRIVLGIKASAKPSEPLTVPPSPRPTRHP